MGTAEFVNVDSDKKARFGKGLVSAEGLRVGAGVGKAVKLMRLLKKLITLTAASSSGVWWGLRGGVEMEGLPVHLPVCVCVLCEGDPCHVCDGADINTAAAAPSPTGVSCLS